MTFKKTIGILAAEPSGDLVGAGLMRAIKARHPSVIFEGIGGPLMRAEGCVSIFKTEQLSVMGVFEVLAKLPTLLSIRRQIKKYFSNHLPDIFIGIDAPDFNLNIEGFLKKQGVKTVHYNSPTVWAWRKNRILKIKKTTDMMLTLFPFEEAIYEQHEIPVKFIGHPLADASPEIIDIQTSRKKLNIQSQGPIIALLPGSRASEIKYLAPLFLETAKWCLAQNPQLKFIVPMVNEERLSQLKQSCSQLLEQLPIQFFVGSSVDVITAADVVLVASGTATLETALLQKPMVVAYRMNVLNYYIARFLIKVPYFSLPNLLLNKKMVPEFFQDEATKERLGSALMEQLQRTKDLVLLEDFKYLRRSLAKSANIEAAKAVLSLI